MGCCDFLLLWPFVGVFIGFSFSGFSVVNRSSTTIEKIFSTGVAANFLFAACLDSLNDGFVV